MRSIIPHPSIPTNRTRRKDAPTSRNRQARQCDRWPPPGNSNTSIANERRGETKKQHSPTVAAERLGDRASAREVGAAAQSKRQQQWLGCFGMWGVVLAGLWQLLIVGCVLPCSLVRCKVDVQRIPLFKQKRRNRSFQRRFKKKTRKRILIWSNYFSLCFAKEGWHIRVPPFFEWERLSFERGVSNRYFLFFHNIKNCNRREFWEDP